MAAAPKPVLSSYKDRMDKAVLALKEEFASLRTGRASAGLLDQVMVDAYGSTVPISQVAAVSVPEPRMLTVNVWDKGVAVSVEKAIRNSGLGLNPVRSLGHVSRGPQELAAADAQAGAHRVNVVRLPCALVPTAARRAAAARTHLEPAQRAGREPGPPRHLAVRHPAGGERVLKGTGKDFVHVHWHLLR